MRRFLLFSLSLILLTTLSLGCSIQEKDRPVYPVTVEVTVEVTPVTPTPTSTPTGFTGSLEYPVPFGQGRQVIVEEDKTIEIVLREAYRGEEAWSRILEANQFNDPPPKGQEYLLIWAEVAYIEGPPGEMLSMGEWNFRMISKGNVQTPPAIVDPEPRFQLVLLPGTTLGGGWMTWLIHEDDPAPLLVIGIDYQGQGGIFFMAYDDSEWQPPVPGPSPGQKDP
jgi:hypothetical protein